VAIEKNRLALFLKQENNLRIWWRPVDQDQTLAHPETPILGSLKACAMPTRWSIPLEYWRSCFWADSWDSRLILIAGECVGAAQLG